MGIKVLGGGCGTRFKDFSNSLSNLRNSLDTATPSTDITIGSGFGGSNLSNTITVT